MAHSPAGGSAIASLSHQRLGQPAVGDAGQQITTRLVPIYLGIAFRNSVGFKKKPRRSGAKETCERACRASEGGNANRQTHGSTARGRNRFYVGWATQLVSYL